MIEAIHLANEAAYDADGTRIDGLKALNFIFGPNGAGKTTISRVIDTSEIYPDCTITWIAGNPLETRVFANDDLYTSCDPGQIERYLAVFRRIFESSGHGGHYEMMMGSDYVALPAANEPNDEK